MIIGITGKSGCGKSFAAEILAKELDAIHLDIDKISHEVLEFPESKKFLVSEFGSCIFNNNKIDRKKIGNIVFGNTAKLKKLNIYCKFQIEKKIDEILFSTKKPIILDYALLCGLKQFDSCNIKILLKTDFETRYNRVFERENISRDYFISRDNSLEDYDETKFDYIFENITNNQIKQLANLIKQK